MWIGKEGIGGGRSRREGIGKEGWREKRGKLAGRSRDLAGRQQGGGCCVWRWWTFERREGMGRGNRRRAGDWRERSRQHLPSAQWQE